MSVSMSWATAAYAQENLTEYVAETVRAQVTPIIIGVLAAVVACIVYDLAKNLNWSWTPQGVAMAIVNKRRRKRAVRAIAAWLITEGIEEGVYKDRLTREEADELYQKIGSRCDMPDLLPTKSRYRIPDVDELKEAIRNRINRKKPPSIKSILIGRNM